MWKEGRDLRVSRYSGSPSIDVYRVIARYLGKHHVDTTLMQYLFSTAYKCYEVMYIFIKVLKERQHYTMTRSYFDKGLKQLLKRAHNHFITFPNKVPHYLSHLQYAECPLHVRTHGQPNRLSRKCC